MVQKYNDLISSVSFLIFSTVMYMLSFQIKKLTITPIGADSAPKMLAILLFICSIVLFIKSLKELKHKKNKAINIGKYKKPLISFTCLVVYMLILNTVGFLLSTLIFLLSQFILFNDRKKSLLLYSVLSISITLIIYFLFTKILYVFLPSGILG